MECFFLVGLQCVETEANFLDLLHQLTKACGLFPVNSCYTGPVTIADQATEAAMCSIISNHFPHHAMYVLSTYLSKRVNFIISSDLLREIEFSIFLICENLLIHIKKIMMRIGCLTSPVCTFRSATTCSLHHNPLPLVLAMRESCYFLLRGEARG